MYQGNWDIVRAEVDSVMARSVAVIRGNPVSNPSLTGTCGITFVSKHYAITAAHCIPASSPIQAAHINAANTTADTVSSQAYVTGSWPNLQHATQLTASQGYQVFPFQCVAVRRCDTTNSTCPLKDANNVQISADMALLYCANRPQTDWISHTNPTTEPRARASCCRDPR